MLVAPKTPRLCWQFLLTKVFQAKIFEEVLIITKPTKFLQINLKHVCVYQNMFPKMSSRSFRMNK